MKENKHVYYKARVWMDDKGDLHGLAFANKQIPTELICSLYKAMYEVVDSFNGKTSWKENYIKFTDKGKRYEQFDDEDANTPCASCVFYGKRCQHPHYYYKGYCEKPYKEVNTEK